MKEVKFDLVLQVHAKLKEDELKTYCLCALNGTLPMSWAVSFL